MLLFNKGRERACLTTWHALAAAALFFSCSAVARAQKQDLRPLPPDIEKAWQGAGARLGWFGADPVFKAEPSPGNVPAFSFPLWREGSLVNLPAPDQAFGLDLGALVTDAALKELTRFPNLVMLKFYSRQGVTATGLKELAALKKLNALDVYIGDLTEAGLKELAAIGNLTSLTITVPSDDLLKGIGTLHRLTRLRLRGRVTAAGVKNLATLKNLRLLRCSGTGLSHLADLKNLAVLELSGELTTDTLKQLA